MRYDFGPIKLLPHFGTVRVTPEKSSSSSFRALVCILVEEVNPITWSATGQGDPHSAVHQPYTCTEYPNQKHVGDSAYVCGDGVGSTGPGTVTLDR